MKKEGGDGKKGVKKRKDEAKGGILGKTKKSEK